MKASDVALFVKSERVKQGLSVSKFAEKTGICHSTIHSFEKGKRIPMLDTFLILADSLGYEVILKKKKEIK